MGLIHSCGFFSRSFDKRDRVRTKVVPGGIDIGLLEISDEDSDPQRRWRYAFSS